MNRNSAEPKIDTSWLGFATGARFVLEPDPAWDGSETDNDELIVELTWLPDALAGRLEELVASAELTAALVNASITGVTTARARAVITDNSFIDMDAAAPTVVRLIVGHDPTADLAFVPGHGLVASPRATAIIAGHCDRIDISPYIDA